MESRGWREWPLVGRAAELAFIREVVDDQRPGLVLAGDAGVGKSRLAREASAMLADRGWEVVDVRATRSASTTPLAPFAAFLPRGGGPPGDRLDLLLRASQEVRDRAAGRPAAVAVDDAHLLDDLSATFLQQLVHERVATLIVTIRSGEPAPDAVTALWKEGDLPRLEVQALAPADVGPLLEQVLDGPVATETVEQLSEKADGNPLLLREIVLDALETGSLSKRTDLWRLSGAVRPGDRLQEIVDARLGAVSPVDRRLLEVLAVAEPLGVELLERLAPEASLADAERRGHVRAEHSERRLEVRLAHPLYAEVLLAQLPAVAERDICAAVADEITAHGARRSADLELLARWHVEGLAPSPGADVLAAMAIEAAGGSAYPEAERMARAALTEFTSSDAAYALALALIGQARWKEAGAALDDAASLATTDEQRVRIAVERLQSPHTQEGRGDEVLAQVEQAEAEIEDATWAAFLRAHRAGVHLLMRQPDEVLRLSEGLFDPGVDDVVRVRAFGAAGPIIAAAGRVDEALTRADELMPAALRLHGQLPRAPMWVVTTRMAASLLGGYLEPIGNFLDGALQLPMAAGRGAQAALRLARGRLHLLQGQVVEARRDLLEAVGTFRVAPELDRGLLAWGLALLTEAHTLLGDVEAAGQAATDAASVPRISGAPFDGDADRARAWRHVAAGTLSVAIDELATLADHLDATGQCGVGVWVAHDLVRLGAPDLAVDLFARWGDTVEGHWVRAATAHAAALVADDGEALERAATQIEEMGARLHAGDAWAQAAGAFERSGLRARAAAALRRAREHRSACDGATTPALSEAAAPVALTRREREVATLAARGLSNKEIAEHLVVSVRTVEGHLYQAFAKLGVNDRSALPGLLG